jgi:hypothetical protein
LGKVLESRRRELTDYAGHLGWLHGRDSIPNKGPPESLAYLADALRDVGYCWYSGGYQNPLGWAELESWQRQTGNILTPWEVETLHAMSRAYVRGMNAKNDPAKAGALAVRDAIKAAFGGK